MARKTKDEAVATRAAIVDAARRVFYERGVSRTSLDMVAKAAGVTRGAVYWHFANKAELFFAVKQEYTGAFESLKEILDDTSSEDPLALLGRYMTLFFARLLSDPEAMQTYEIMLLRCEYVDEFSSVLNVLTEPCTALLDQFRAIYKAAITAGTITASLDADLLARDTTAFMMGVFQGILVSRHLDAFSENIDQLIDAHLNLRAGP